MAISLTPDRSRWIWLLGAFAAAALGSLVACDPSSQGARSPARCAAAGDQCELPNGPLGVCERSACAPGETPPCFQCTPQH